MPSVQVEPSGLTLKWKSSLPPSATVLAANSVLLSLALRGLVVSAVVPTPSSARFWIDVTVEKKSPQAVPFHSSSVPSSATNATQPVCGVLKIQAPSCQAAIALTWPAQAPVAPVLTIQRWPSAGDEGGAAGSRASTASCTSASGVGSAPL